MISDKSYLQCRDHGSPNLLRGSVILGTGPDIYARHVILRAVISNVDFNFKLRRYILVS